MLGRALRLLFRIAGWLITPLVITAMAAVGGAIGFLLFTGFSDPRYVAAAAFGSAFLGAFIGSFFWLRVLRGSPRLREALAVTPGGLPESEAVHEILQAISLEDKPPK